MFKRIFIALFLLIYTGISRGQQFHFEVYSLNEGLPRSGVYHIHQDKYGFLWIGTDGGGVAKFDGYNFKDYTKRDGLASEKVRIIFEDTNGILWFGTNNGLSYFDGDKFKSLTVEDGLSDNFIRTIAQDSEGNLWIGTNKGITIIDPDEKGVSGKLTMSFTLPDKKVRTLLASGTTMWIGTDEGLCKYVNNELVVLTEEDGLSNNLILTLYESRDGSVWIGTENGLNKLNDSIVSWNVDDGLVTERVRNISEDLYGNIWIGTNDGISVFNGHDFHTIDESNGLTNNRIRCITEDNFNNIWIGTYFGGILRYNHQDFQAYTTSHGLPSRQIVSIAQDHKGYIYASTDEGISKIKINESHNSGFIHSESYQIGFHKIATCMFISEEGTEFFGTDDGLFIINGDVLKHYDKKDGLKNDHITSITLIDSVYWLGTEDGFARIKLTDSLGLEYVKCTDHKDGLAGAAVSSIIKNDNQIWISFSDGGLSVLDNEKLINPILPAELNEIISLCFDNSGRIWLGTNGQGIYYGNYSSAENKLQLKNISVQNNLTSNYIFSLMVVKDRIWAGHEKGLDLLSIEGDSVKVMHSYGPERGFFGLQNTANSSLLDDNGNMWFGTVNGLFMLRKRAFDSFKRGEVSINYIQSIKINGSKINWNESEYCNGTSEYFGLPKELSLPYNQNNVEFDFIGINFISPEKVKYKWRLEGFQDKWAGPSSKRYVTYTNLESGDYTFEVLSSDEHGVFQNNPVRYNFTIEKPFWESWAFRIAAVIIGFFAVMFFTRLRTKNLRKTQKKLEDEINLRTAEIQAKNSELENQKTEIENSNKALSDKNKEITSSIVYSKRIQKSLLPGVEKVNKLIPNNFIFYKPKDIISGDFYWVEESPHNKNLVHFAVADCTGHGVPGAMVSVIGTRALNSAILIENSFRASEILNETNKIVQESFIDKETGQIIKDGMDIALVTLDKRDKDNLTLYFAGANNPIWIVRSSEFENLDVNGEKLAVNLQLNNFNLFEIKGNRQPIGHFDHQEPFTNFIIKIKKGDRLYMSSDGYADQFGGEFGKKFKYKNLKAVILENQNEDLPMQRTNLLNVFNDWKGELEQIDDICFMCVEI